MLLSGKAEVTLIAFVIAGTALMVFGLYATVIRCTIVSGSFPCRVLYAYGIYFAVSDAQRFNGNIPQDSFSHIGADADCDNR